MSNNKSFYRYRSVEKLLNQHELQDGYIYFSPFKDLNDPMEGFIKLIWDGDLIAWKNLLRMYIVCLDDTLASLSVGRAIDYKNHELPVFLQDSYFEGTSGKIHLEICTRTYQEIIAIPSVKNFLDYIAARHEVDRTELKFYLDLLHGIILEALCRHSVSCKFLSANPLEKHRDGIHADFNKRFAVLSKMFLSSTITNLDIELSDRFDFYHIFKQYDSSLKDDDGDYRSILVLGYKFPQIFLDNLGKLIFNDWYVASFSTDFSNSSMWAYYGENHCGVCLEFCATQSECLPLLIKTGISSRKG